MDKLAGRRFTMIALVSMVLLAASSMTVPLAGGKDALPQAVVWGTGLVSVAALLAPLWALWRYLWQVDEYLRSIQFKAIFFGLVILLVVLTGWGYLELYMDLPRLPMYWLNPLYWAAYSGAVMFLSLHQGAET